MSANSPPGTGDNGVETSRPSVPTKSSYGDNGASRKQSSEKLRAELVSLKSDLDNLVGRAANLSERELSEAYARLMTRFGSMRYAAKGMAAEAGRQLNQGVDMTSDYVKTRPLQSVAIAAAVGLMLGMMMTRR